MIIKVLSFTGNAINDCSATYLAAAIIVRIMLELILLHFCSKLSPKRTLHHSPFSIC